MINVILFIERINRFVILSFSILLFFIISLANFYIHYDISFSIFFLIPISLTVVFFNFSLGLVFSFLSAISWLIADIGAGHVYEQMWVYYWNAFVRFGYFALHSYILSRFVALYVKTKKESMTDQITETANYRYFRQLFIREFERAKRENSYFTLAYIDIDNFKLVNDLFGHSYGNDLLKEISLLILKNIRGIDIFARIGGDEFILLLPDTDEVNFMEILKRLHNIVVEELRVKNTNLSISIGAVLFERYDVNIDEMLKIADEYMYKVKQKGKNGIEFFIKK